MAASKKAKDQTEAQPALKPPSTSPARLRRWQYKILAAVVFFSFIAYQVGRPQLGIPETYALCSSEGRGIYTIDENDTTVECVLVHGAYVVDSGDLGVSFLFSGCTLM